MNLREFLLGLAALAILGVGGVARAGELTLRANDGVVVSGEFRAAQKGNTRVVLLFHQAGSNRHEYDPMVSSLHAAGFDTLAIDQRSGGKRWGHDNLTVRRRGTSATYIEALPDLEAAVDWAEDNQYGTIVCVGSSYSAALVFRIAGKYKKSIDAIASFSPGEYMGGKHQVAPWAAELTLPIYVSAAANAREQRNVDAVLSKRKVGKGRATTKVTRHRAKHGVHGVSTMRKDRNARGWKTNRDHFIQFLRAL